MPHPSSMSPVKLGLSVAWSTFWTGAPLKFVLALLFLAMGLHPWEMPGLAFLLLLSIPIDIWALNLTARTVFLDRLRVEPPDNLGLTLWWQMAVASAVYLPIAYFIESGVISVTKSMAATIMEWFKSIPVAERITIELNLWGVPSAIVLLILVLGWLWILGRIIGRQAAQARPADASYVALVRRWDLLRVPRDQALALTLFTATGVVLIILFWVFMPVTTPHVHPDYKKADAKAEAPFRPVETLHKTEKIIAQAEASVEALEAKAEDVKPSDKAKAKGADKGPAKEAAAAKAEPVAAKASAAGHDGGHEHKDDGHKH